MNYDKTKVVPKQGADIPGGAGKDTNPPGTTTLPTAFERGEYTLEDFSSYNTGTFGGVPNTYDPDKPKGKQ